MALLTCCGCISLERGSLVLGILNCLGYLMFFIQCVISAIALEEISNITDKKASFLLKGLYAGIIALLIIMIIMSIIFIIGINKRNKKFVSPFVAIKFAQLILSIPADICYVTFKSFDDMLSGGSIFGILLLCILYTALEGYFWFVIYYHYKTLVKRGHSPALQHQSV